MTNNLFFGSASHREKKRSFTYFFLYTTHHHPHYVQKKKMLLLLFRIFHQFQFVHLNSLFSFPPSPPKKTTEENFLSTHTHTYTKQFFFFLVCSLDKEQPPIADESVFQTHLNSFSIFFPGQLFFSSNERELSVKKKELQIS